MEQSVYVVGDIHGCYDALVRMEEAVRNHAARRGHTPFIVSVGDLIDRGPDSLAVVRRLMRGVEAGTHAVVAGNHEACLFEVLFASCPEAQALLPLPDYIVPLERQFRLDREAHAGEWRDFVRVRRRSWLRQGGAVTIESFGGNADIASTWLESTEELRFLAGLPLIWENDTTVVSHALASPQDVAYARRVAMSDAEVGHDSSEHAVSIEGLLWNREYPVEPADEVRVHVSGHTPAQEVVRMPGQRRIVVDTACVYGNKLTAWCEETDTIVQVKGQKCVW